MVAWVYPSLHRHPDDLIRWPVVQLAANHLVLGQWEPARVAIRSAAQSEDEREAVKVLLPFLSLAEQAIYILNT